MEKKMGKLFELKISKCVFLGSLWSPNLNREKRRIKSFLKEFPLRISEPVIISQIRIVTAYFGDYNGNTCDFKLPFKN